MATKQEEIRVMIVAGPSEMQLMTSLMRPGKGPYGIDMDRATSVHFTTDGSQRKVPTAFSTTVGGMKREDGSGNLWLIEGHLIDCPNIGKFNGYYDGKTRKGYLTLTLR